VLRKACGRASAADDTEQGMVRRRGENRGERGLALPACAAQGLRQEKRREDDMTMLSEG
jgi:hypothetical protein